MLTGPFLPAVPLWRHRVAALAVAGVAHGLLLLTFDSLGEAPGAEAGRAAVTVRFVAPDQPGETAPTVPEAPLSPATPSPTTMPEMPEMPAMPEASPTPSEAQPQPYGAVPEAVRRQLVETLHREQIRRQLRGHSARRPAPSAGLPNPFTAAQPVPSMPFAAPQFRPPHPVMAAMGGGTYKGLPIIPLYQLKVVPALPPENVRVPGSHGGWVHLRALVTSPGYPSEIVIMRGSGSAELDRVLVSAAWRWRFGPGHPGARIPVGWVDIIMGGLQRHGAWGG